MLRDHPELAMLAVEEQHGDIRRLVRSTLRTVREDVELGGFIFPTGTFIFVNSFAANGDPAIDGNPDRFDITLSSRRRRSPSAAAFHHRLGEELLAVLAELTPRRLPHPPG